MTRKLSPIRLGNSIQLSSSVSRGTGTRQLAQRSADSILRRPIASNCDASLSVPRTICEHFTGRCKEHTIGAVTLSVDRQRKKMLRQASNVSQYGSKTAEERLITASE